MAVITAPSRDRLTHAPIHPPFHLGRVAGATARALDLAGGLTLIVLAAPLMAMVALAVRVTSSGPALFRQQRVGKDGRPFQMLKFRTMRAGADSRPHERFVRSLMTSDVAPRRGVLCKLVDDERVTPVGRLLRRLSIDELPQLFNVVRGDMRLVGPRPALPYEVELYEPWQRRRLEVKPGMTGLWQVSGRSRLGYHEMVRLDLRYVDTWSIRQEDIRILLRTIPALLRVEAA